MLNAKPKKAQSTLEYVVVFTAIIGVILLAASGFFKTGVKQSMDDAQTAFGNAADKLNAAIPAPTAAPVTPTEPTDPGRQVPEVPVSS